MYRRSSGTSGGTIGEQLLGATVDRVIAASPGHFGREAVVAAARFSYLPAPIREQAKAEGYDDNGKHRDGYKMAGATYDDKVYLVHEKIPR